MFHKTKKIEKLSQQIVKLFQRQDAPEVRLLPEDQLVIRKDIIPNPTFEQGGKVETFVPGEAGYQIYVAYHSPSTYATNNKTSQRMVGPAVQPETWNASSMGLQVDRECLVRDWLILNSEEKVVSISVKCGSEQVLEEVNMILAQIAETLLL